MLDIAEDDAGAVDGRDCVRVLDPLAGMVMVAVVAEPVAVEPFAVSVLVAVAERVKVLPGERLTVSCSPLASARATVQL